MAYYLQPLAMLASPTTRESHLPSVPNPQVSDWFNS